MLQPNRPFFMADRPVVLYIDRYRLDDVLFLQSFARAMAVRPEGPPFVVCHGAGDVAERAFEAEGHFPPREGGRLVLTTGHEHLVLDRAVRTVTRKVAGMLTDAVVSAVALSGADRGVISLSSTGEVKGGPAEWLRGLLAKRVVPVVGLVARTEGGDGVADVAPEAGIRALCDAAEATEVAFFGQIAPSGVPRSDDRPPPVSMQLARETGGMQEAAAASALARNGLSIYLLDLADLRTRPPSAWPLLAG